ncbi:hypothetical protein E2C01_040259 [Portunus trituberculatus]|uniref:Uncharacterized protein n=1 Tax=Portunus trituberculatus TaxID=210409 RepID=A0A5B7FMV7_PORTR|nr:hypothetical protein [Portunus trituberculatus]
MKALHERDASATRAHPSLFCGLRLSHQWCQYVQENTEHYSLPLPPRLSLQPCLNLPCPSLCCVGAM